MQDAERKFKLKDAGLQDVREVNDGTPKGQIDRLRQFANQSDIAAIAVSVTDSNNPAIARAMEECQAAGIKVIAIDSDVDRQTSRQARFAYLGTDKSSAAGARQGGRGHSARRRQVCHFRRTQRSGQRNRTHRRLCSGAGEKFPQVENLGDNMDRSVAKKNVKDALDRHADVFLHIPSGRPFSFKRYSAPRIEL